MKNTPFELWLLTKGSHPIVPIKEVWNAALDEVVKLCIGKYNGLYLTETHKDIAAQVRNLKSKP